MREGYSSHSVCVSVRYLTSCHIYRIAGNFRGRKLSRNVKTGRIMGVACLEFRGENFRGRRKNCEIRESFLPRKFPAIRYLVCVLCKIALFASFGIIS